MSTAGITSYSRAISRHSAALNEARACRRAGMDSAAQLWMDLVREWASYARTYYNSAKRWGK